METNLGELQQFHHFIGEKIANGGNSLSPEQCLDEWRSTQLSPNELTESVARIRLALDQIERGEGTPFEEFDRDFRRKFQIPSDA